MMRHVVSGAPLAIKQPHSKNSNDNSYSNLQNIPNFQAFVGGRCHWHRKKTGISENIYLHFLCK